MAQQRLQKVLAAAGIDSRRKCEELILEGAVRVNDEVVDKLPFFVDAEKDVITVNGQKLRLAKKMCFLLNKPKGVTCNDHDPQGRKKVIDIVKTGGRIFCIGRLDTDSPGPVILTNDSELADKLTHPKYELPKTYIAEVKGQIEAEAVEKLKRGVWLSEGRTATASVKILRRGRTNSLLEITIRQGLNRQIRRMLAKVGLPVKSLKRTQIGKLDTHKLGVGRFRPLTEAEVAYLKKTVDS